ARADERSLRHRKNCRRKALPGIFSRVRRELYLCAADEPLRAERQLRSRNIARAGGAFAKSARSKAKWRARVGGVGNGHAAPRILLDVSKLSALGWSPTIPLRDGIARTYDWFLKNYR